MTENARKMIDFDIGRRSLLQGAALGAAALAAGPGLMASAGAAALRPDDAFWDGIRGRFVLNPEMRFMNIGTSGSMPLETLNILDSESREAARLSAHGYGRHDAYREAIAPGFGADPDEIVISGNTSDGMCIALQGLVWEEGDEIVTTNHEHPGGDSPMRLLRDRFGVVINRVEVPVGNDQTAQDYVDMFAAAITPRTKALVFSSPTFITGTLLPVRRLAELAHDRGLVTIVDGAHLPGMMNINCHELGIDFMAGAAHKWQCGPLGTGILYVRNKVREEMNPLPLPGFYPITTSSYPDGGLPERMSAGAANDDMAGRIQSCGSRNAPVYAAVANVCEIWDRIGRQNIEDYVVSMGTSLKERIAEEWGVEALYSPKDDPELLCALTAFNPFRNPAMVTDRDISSRFVSRLREEYNFIIRNVGITLPGSEDRHWGVRVSTHLWSDMDQVDQLVAAMKELADDMAA